MKNSVILPLILVSILFCQCKKERQAYFTHIHFKATDWLTGDTLPFVKFVIANQSNNANYQVVQTNQYGRFDTLMSDYYSEFFSVNIDNNENYYLLSQNNVFPQTDSLNINLQLIGLGNLSYNFDCGGPGEIKNFEVKYLNLEAYPYELTNTSYMQSNYAANPYCGSTTQKTKMVAGKWQIAYNWKPTSSSSVWQAVTDTVTIYSDSTVYYSVYY